MELKIKGGSVQLSRVGVFVFAPDRDRRNTMTEVLYGDLKDVQVTGKALKLTVHGARKAITLAFDPKSEAEVRRFAQAARLRARQHEVALEQGDTEVLEGLAEALTEALPVAPEAAEEEQEEASVAVPEPRNGADFGRRRRTLAVVAVLSVLAALTLGVTSLTGPSAPKVDVTSAAPAAPSAAPAAPATPAAPAPAAPAPAAKEVPAGVLSSVIPTKGVRPMDVLEAYRAANLPVAGARWANELCKDGSTCIQAAVSDQVTVQVFDNLEGAKAHALAHAQKDPKGSYQVGGVVLTFSPNVDERIRGWYRTTTENLVVGKEITRHP